VSLSSEEHVPDNQEKNDTVQDDSEDSDDRPYEEDNMFSDDDYEGFVFVQDVTCNMNDKAGIPDSWILLNSQSAVDIFKNKKLFKIIRDAKKALSLHCNAGIATVDKIEDLPGYATVWFYEDGIANILSLNNVKKKYRVTYNSSAYDCFEVHKADGTKRVFKPSKKGLFYSCLNNDTVLVTTVENKINKYTVREYANAKKALDLQNIIGMPSTQDLIKYVENNMILNFLMTKQEILRVEDIFRPYISIKGKTTHTKQKNVQDLQDIPQEIMEKHGEVTLAIDVMFINKIPFVMRTSRNIHFGTEEIVKDMKNNMLITSINQVIQAYQTRRFKIKAILVDGQFRHIQQQLEQKGVILNICATNEHVQEIERNIRTVKERVRSIATTLPFKQYLPRLIVKMVYNCIFWLNSFPHKDSVHPTISPRAIMTGKRILYDKHCKVEFGTYVQMHEKHNNSMEPRTLGAIQK